MPIPTVAQNKIFNPESGMFSWQKFLDANKDTGKQQADAYNQKLQGNFQNAANLAAGVQSGLGKESAEINKTKEDTAKYLNQSPSVGNSPQGAPENVKKAAAGGYKVDPDRYKNDIAAIEKQSADLDAANRIAGRMGSAGQSALNMNALFDQALLQQGGAGQGADKLSAQLKKTLELLKGQQSEVGSQAAGLQKSVVDSLSSRLEGEQEEVMQNSLAQGKNKVNDLLNKDLNYQKAFGAQLPTLLRGGVDPNSFISRPNLNEEDYLAYGKNPEMDRLNEIRGMLGMQGIGLGPQKKVENIYDVGAATNKYNFLKDLDMQKADELDRQKAADLNKQNFNYSPSSFHSVDVPVKGSSEMKQVPDEKLFMVPRPKYPEPKLNYNFRKLLQDRSR